MNKVLDVIKVVAAVVMLGVLMYIVWRFKFVILCIVIGYALVLVLVNATYKRIMGKDMSIYTRITK